MAGSYSRGLRLTALSNCWCASIVVAHRLGAGVPSLAAQLRAGVGAAAAAAASQVR